MSILALKRHHISSEQTDPLTLSYPPRIHFFSLSGQYLTFDGLLFTDPIMF